MKVFFTLAIITLAASAFAQNVFPSSGNAGIGTLNPGSNLEVVNSGAMAIVTVRHQTEQAGWGLFMRQTSDLKGMIACSGRDLQIESGWTNSLILGDIQYNTYNGKVIFPGGKIGIGTSTPQEKLHVEGNIYIGNNQMQFLSTAGGNNRIFSVSGDVNSVRGSWNFKSRFDNIVLDAGENAGNERQIIFKTAGSTRMVLDEYGNFGIGTSVPDAKLAVLGAIHANEVRVDLNVPGPDYVFENDYSLPTLEELNAYIKVNKHLPDVPSACSMEEKGVNLGDMNMLLLRKVEELTLYMIELKKENTQIKEENARQNNLINELIKK